METRETAKLRPVLRSAMVRRGTPIGRNLPRYSRAADQYLTLALNVEGLRPNLAPDLGFVIAVVGAEPGCGKTLTALNLALALGKGWDLNVLLVEGDIWKPSLAEYLELGSNEPGLVQVLSREAKERDAISAVREYGKEIGETPFSVLHAGPRTDSEDLVAGPRMKGLVDTLRSRWERVIIDCPPIELASARGLALAADLVLVVVRAGRTRQRQIESALQILGSERRVAFVLNAARDHGNSAYYYG